MKYKTQTELLEAAIELLSDNNLVWSTDFEQIRVELKKWMRYELTNLRVRGHTDTVASLEVAGRLLENA